MKEQAKVVLGAWAWGDNNSYFGNNYGQAHFQEVYDEAIKNGLNFWDTAVAYGNGASETLLGSLMKNTPREDLVISTKFTPQMADNSENPIESMFNGSLKRLNTDYIDYYWIHNDADVEKWTPLIIPLLKLGKIKHVGVSNHTLSEIKRIQEILGKAGFKLDAVQNHLSLLDRTSEQAGILDYCKENNITFFAYMVLEQGALSGKYNVDTPFPAGSVRAQVYNNKLPQLTDLINTLHKIGQRHDLSTAQTAMAWALAKGALPIIGVTKLKQVDDAAGVAQSHLTSEEIKTLEEVADKAGVNTIGSWEQDMRKDK
ncbi:aldo/keto reductase [Limosilactobacillus agrestis]|uniref:aldo/keto reductase n=1 Tax=Limosilactobacillus agrestis TaxID=2759748 RepID=UPI001E2A4214|nr:aldo/keto reductase [Limosilactobacillus agrestis]MCD7113249.1 aldo/keto reductase [Limosilactobacillus agrestis]